MREIKFRVWDSVLNKMIYQGDRPCSHFFSGMIVETDTVMQYTGLKDKNSVEIYEGDIYSFPVVDYIQDDGTLVSSFSVRVVKHQVGGHIAGFQLLSHSTNVQIIGNIHETPELLT